VRGVIFWLMGGLGAADWIGFRWTLIGTLPPLLLIFGTARWQNLLLLGDEAALSLGLDVAHAVAAAKRFVTDRLRASRWPMLDGAGPVAHWFADDID
jgi:ABC-type Fe3+-siderophore transport system permease subunit